MSQPYPSDSLLSGDQLREALAAASQHLRESAAAIDAINVYPVPDGDTGSNMSATFREAVEQTSLLPGSSAAGEVLRTLARGALYGARGNSGVILSQALRGLASGVGEAQTLDAAALARGLAGASAAAYAAVSEPKEGTMLTVLREAAEAAGASAASMPGAGEGLPCITILAGALASAERAEAATIDMLPALTEAGVPDAGGEGVCVILRGLLASLTGTLPAPPILPARPIASMAGHESAEFGFCTEFIIECAAAPLDVEAVRALVSAEGNTSVVVVGDADAVRVHVHTPKPEAVLEAAAALGKVGRAKVDDMTAQNVRFGASGSGATARIGLLALSRGEGLNAIFRELGAEVSDLGHVVKPPAGEIARAATGMKKADVIVLPNHKNVVPAAAQAASLSQSTVHIIPTENLPQGIAAALAFDPESSIETNLREMEAAANAIRVIEVTVAAASRRADGVDARAGEAIALLDGTLMHSAIDPLDCLEAGLSAAGASDGALVTVYRGEGNPPAAEAIRERIESTFPGVEVEIIEGGQPLYPLIASVEA